MAREAFDEFIKMRAKNLKNIEISHEWKIQ
jgi:hypothetical protein